MRELVIEYLYQEGVAPCSSEPLLVRINGQICGEIRKVGDGFQYFPKGQKTGGRVFPTVEHVQFSLMGVLC